MNDIISREAVADAINGIECTRHTTWYEFYQKVMTAVEKLPSAEPKVGKWERHYSRPNVYADLFWHCSECGYRSSDNWADKFNFCPNCGAKMEGSIYE